LSTVATRLGKIRGFSEKNVISFLGVRYAAPPMGGRRFMASEMAGRWRGEYDATQFPNRAMQNRTLSTLGLPVSGSVSEDCLFLNIVTPSVSGSLRPVIVWFHGGGFVAGSANEYDGTVLAGQGDVVVVTVNSRLGPFGFLDLAHFGAAYLGSASNGLRDQILALTWISENIQDYGGDPKNVTISGQSSGGSSVLSLLACPSADELYHKAVACSPTAVYSPQTNRAEDLADRLNCAPEDCLDVLLNMSAMDLVNMQIGSRITVDGHVVTRSTFEAIEDRGGNGVPLLTGTTLTEGSYYTKGDPQTRDHYPWLNNYLARDMLCGEDPGRYLDALRTAYPAASPGKIHEMVWTDMFRRTAITAAELSSTKGAGGWLYRFDLPVNASDSEHVGTPHACDMSFMFNTVAKAESHAYTFHDGKNPTVQSVGLSWSKRIVSMARFGNPNPSREDLPHWPRYEPENRSCFLVDDVASVVHDADSKHALLWR
jgi:para-nitrobenzyl esterase